MTRSQIAVAQMDCTFGDVAKNLEKIGSLVREAATQGADLVVFPELATTGYFIADRIAELAEPIPGPTTEELVCLAQESQTWLVVGMAEAADGKYFNSSVLISPAGLVGTYRKVHLFDSEKETFALGDQRGIFDTPFGKLGLTICYDLLFPEYIRSLALAGADIIINSTNWIADDYQREVWRWTGESTQALAATRGLENTVHVAMAARTGEEAGFRSLGHSCITTPSGAVSGLVKDGEGIAVAEVVTASDDLSRWREIAPYLKDRRTELYRRWDG